MEQMEFFNHLKLSEDDIELHLSILKSVCSLPELLTVVACPNEYEPEIVFPVSTTNCRKFKPQLPIVPSVKKEPNESDSFVLKNEDIMIVSDIVRTECRTDFDRQIRQISANYEKSNNELIVSIEPLKRKLEEEMSHQLQEIRESVETENDADVNAKSGSVRREWVQKKKKFEDILRDEIDSTSPLRVQWKALYDHFNQERKEIQDDLAKQQDSQFKTSSYAREMEFSIRERLEEEFEAKSKRMVIETEMQCMEVIRDLKAEIDRLKLLNK